MTTETTQPGPGPGEPGPSAAPAEVVGKKKRGRESSGDMVRSLGLTLAAVVVVWYFAQPPDSDEQALRVVDPSGDVRAFTTDVPGTPVPQGLPEQWRTTVSTRDGSTSLRLGYVTPDGRYAEYAASTESAQTFVAEITGVPRGGSTEVAGAGEPDSPQRLEPVDVAGVSWEQYRDADGSLSLVRTSGPVTVVAGTTRATATLDELRVLVQSLQPG